MKEPESISDYTYKLLAVVNKTKQYGDTIGKETKKSKLTNILIYTNEIPTAIKEDCCHE